MNKSIKYLIENNYNIEFTEFPKTGDDLKKIVADRLRENIEEPYLLDIYTGDIKDFSYVFYCFNDYIEQIKDDLNVDTRSTLRLDLSTWDTSNAETMEGMFEMSVFNRDISKWVVSKVKNMGFMFCDSKFNGDISGWDVTSVLDMTQMFSGSIFNGDLSDWDISSVEENVDMFYDSPLKNQSWKRPFKKHKFKRN